MSIAKLISFGAQINKILSDIEKTGSCSQVDLDEAAKLGEEAKVEHEET